MMFELRVYKNLYDMFKVLFGDPIGIGRHRVVFRDQDVVIKLPMNCLGERDNLIESKQRGEMIPRTGLYYSCFVPLLVMEYVEPILSFRDIPKKYRDWAMSIDSVQVGYTLDGRLVAYDYAE